MAVEGETVSHYFILVIRKFFDFMSLFISQSVWFSFSFKQLSFFLKYATYSAEELELSVFAANLS